MTVHRRIAVLGCTGSIGINTLDVVRHLPQRLVVSALVAHSNDKLLAEQCREFQPPIAVLTDPTVYERADRSQFPPSTRLVFGDEPTIVSVVQSPEVDIVVSAVVGAAGLMGTWAAVAAGKTVALANKETLVVAGPLIMDQARLSNARILAVDSEHSAIAQALGGYSPRDVARVVLTGSGGPFRGQSKTQLESVTVHAALQHPTWKMGPKISIDSATLMNKALEVIEARWLFDLDADQIGVIVHPESIVHSFVEFLDGSILAQLSPPDMRLPIQLALLYPERVAGPAKRLDWSRFSALHFEEPDRQTFAALDLGFEAATRGGSVGAVLNAANEVAVAAFLNGQLDFLNIALCSRAVIDHHAYDARPGLKELRALDDWARQEGERWIRMNRQTMYR